MLTNVGPTKGRCIIDPIPRNSHHPVGTSAALHDPELLSGRGSGKHYLGVACQHVVQLTLQHLIQLCSMNHDGMRTTKDNGLSEEWGL